MPSMFPMGILESVAEGIGKSDNDIGGTHFTFLSSDLSPTATTVTVDTTYKFYGAGKIKIGPETLTYTSKTDTTFVISSRTGADGKHFAGSVVIDATRICSEVDTHRRQYSYLTAIDGYLRALLDNHKLNIPDQTVSDALLRAYGQVASYPEAGPLFMVAKGVDSIMSGQLRYGAVSTPGTVELDGAQGGFPAGMNRHLIKILPPAKNAGIYRIHQLTDSNTAVLESTNGEYYDGANFTEAEAIVGVELLPWDLWEHPTENNRFRITTLIFGQFQNVKGAAYLQPGEKQTSASTTTVTVNNPPQQVLGVFLASDLDRTGTNFYLPSGFDPATDTIPSNFSGTTVTLSQALPAASTDVFVDYGAVVPGTAQLLLDQNVDGVDYFPFYLSDPAGTISGFLDAIRSAGMIPVVPSAKVI